VGVGDYIMDSKSMMFLAPIKNSKLAFYFSYTLIVECCEVWVKFLLWRVWLYLGLKSMG